MQKNRHHKAPEYREDRIIRLTNDGDSEVGLLAMLENRITDRSRTDLKSWLRHGQIMVNGVVTTLHSTPVAPGVEIAINITRPFVTLYHPRLKLVYEDADVIVIDKGYGLLSVATNSSKKETSAYDIVREYIKRCNPYNKLFVVHRLDRDTSGLMMFAKNEEAQETLRHNWNNYVLDRVYVALLEGFVKEDSGFVKSRLVENSQYLMYSTDNPNEGKLALTRFKVIKRGHGLSMVEFSLDTGRKNQIRVHAAEMGHPISGDRKYGAKASRLGRLCLHARSLRFAHPVSRKDMSFVSPVPDRFFKAVNTSLSPKLKSPDESNKSKSPKGINKPKSPKGENK